MFYVNPVIKPQFDSLSEDLKTAISKKDVSLNSMNDLMKALEDIVEEGNS